MSKDRKGFLCVIPQLFSYCSNKDEVQNHELQTEKYRITNAASHALESMTKLPLDSHC